MVKIINLKTSKAAKDYIYVGRKMPGIETDGKWGNPIRLRNERDRRVVLLEYEAWLKTQDALLADRHELRGHDLACWCYPRDCHAEILAEVVAMDDLWLECWKHAPMSCLDPEFIPYCERLLTA